MNILVAGGDGFIGSHMVDRLLQEGVAVRVLEPYAPSAARNLNGNQYASLNWVTGTVDDPVTVEAACSGCDMAYYFVSTTSPADTWDDSAREIQEGILRPVRFLETAAEAGVRKVVLPSSGGTVYGRRSGRLTEETPHAPFSPHGIAKCALEHFAGYMRERNGLQVDTYRISNPYGPRQRWDRRQGVVAVWMGQILHGKPLHVYGDDTVERDYIYVGDVAELMMHSLRDLQASGTYNIGSGVGTSIIGLLEAFRRIIPTFFDYTIEPRRAFDNTSAVLDSSKLLSHFPGFEFVHLDEGLRRTWEWFAEKD